VRLAPEAEVREGLLRIWAAMRSAANGLRNEGVLPGGLHASPARARLHRSLQEQAQCDRLDLGAMEWVNLFALAVNEENAAGGRMVTAPTNGAAEDIPAVLHYYMKFNSGACDADVVDFLLGAAAVHIRKRTPRFPVPRVVRRWASPVRWAASLRRYWVLRRPSLKTPPKLP
jgi:L-serine dehydratase